MKIESLTKSEKKSDRFIVRFEDGAEIKVSAAQIADFGLYSGREMTPEENGALRAALEQNTSKARALRILGSRNISAHEIERRLRSKGDSTETAQNTVEWLERAGLINDAEYAASIVQYYSAKGYGPARIKDELYRRGVPREMRDEAMESLDGNEDAAYAYIAKKLKGSRDKADIHKVTNALYARGYSYDAARAAVRKYIENAEDLDADRYTWSNEQQTWSDE